MVKSDFKKNLGKYSRHDYGDHEYRLLCARYWSDAILEIGRQGREWLVSLSGAFMEFSYETLFGRPRSTLEAIGAFLEVDPSGFVFDLAKNENRNRDFSVDTEDPAYRITLAAVVIEGGRSTVVGEGQLTSGMEAWIRTSRIHWPYGLDLLLAAHVGISVPTQAKPLSRSVGGRTRLKL